VPSKVKAGATEMVIETSRGQRVKLVRK